ncbi:MAG: leucine-rich repeat protein [Treponemataceae bacterium]|nr:leucine-rich repeat protein [Treponemataceae bacterium]
MKKRVRWIVVALAVVCAIALVVGCSNGTDESDDPTPIAVESVTLSSSALTLEQGKSYTLSVNITPWNADDKTVTWSSSDTAIARVYSDGDVLAIKGGTATITARVGNKQATCTVTVKTIAVENISLNFETLELVVYGDAKQLTATVTPDNADDKTVTWSSSNTDVAVVEDGRVCPLVSGTATITAQAGGKQAECVVTVKPRNDTAQGSTPQGGTTHVHNYSGGLCTVCGFQKPFMVDATIDDSGVLTKYRGSEEMVEIPDGVTGIGNNAFEECDSLVALVIPGSVTAIGSCAFKKCKNLMYVVISDGVTGIGSHAFEDCSSLSIMAKPNAGTVYSGSVTIPSSVTRIGGYAFSGCNELESVTIPRGVTIIESYAFSGCKELTSVKYNGTKEEWNAIVKGSDLIWGTYDYTITCTDGTIAKQ